MPDLDERGSACQSETKCLCFVVADAPHRIATLVGKCRGSTRGLGIARVGKTAEGGGGGEGDAVEARAGG